MSNHFQFRPSKRQFPDMLRTRRVSEETMQKKRRSSEDEVITCRRSKEEEEDVKKN